MKRNHSLILTLSIFMASSWVMAQPAPPIAKPDGFAGAAGTTGGGEAAPIHVQTADEFKSAAAGDEPKVIVVHGDLGIGSFSVGSNSTIVGADENAGLHGGRINVNGTNYIFQNLTMRDGVDVMEVSGGSKVFVTKCTFLDAGDELFSIVRGADNVTASWCKFHFEKSHDHALVHLIGNSDGATGDRGKLHVTLHHNWYTKGAVGRMPRVRFGYVHVYNNFWDASGNKYCIGVGKECHIRVEGGHFENVNAPWADYGGGGDGALGWRDMIFDASTQPTFIPNTFPVFEPPYAFAADSAKSVKELVMKYAGNVPGNPPGNPTAIAGKTRFPSTHAAGDFNGDLSEQGLQFLFSDPGSDGGPTLFRRLDGKSVHPIRPVP